MTGLNINAHASVPSRRDIDLATGILVGMRGFSEKDAFAELVATAHRSGAGISAVARALIALAGGRQVPISDRGEALSIWGDSFIDRPVRLLATARSA
jgi:ANTAR domain